MKVIALLLGIFCYGLCVYQFFSDRSHLKKLYKGEIPKLFSISNRKVNSISISDVPFKYSTTETDILPLPNSEFTYSPDPFYVDSTDNLKNIGLGCLPELFGYTSEQEQELFPPYYFPKCSEVNSQNDTYIHIDRRTNRLYMNCPENSNKKILVGPFDERKFVRITDAEDKWEVNDYEGEINADKIEFGVGSCEKDGDRLLQAETFPVFNEKAYQNAKKLTEGKPKIIFFLTLDSFSRRHFFRMIPKVVETLNLINSEINSTFSVFDFNFHNVIGSDSPGNQVPILGGKIHFSRKHRGNQDKDFLGDTAMWNLLRKKGYISLLGFESCSDNFLTAIGTIPNVDYAVGNFYCAVEKFAKIKPTMQRCVGGHQSHFYMMNYTLNVLEMNLGVNAFLYIHLDTAQHVIKQHATTLNDDLSSYLTDFLKKYGEKYEVFILLQSDHGTKYGDAYTHLEAYMEHKLPALFIIASNSLLNQYPNSFNSLAENTQRLISKMDLRETALYLADITEKTEYSLNLLDKIAPKSRSCSELDISPWLCSCFKMNDVINPSPHINQIINTLKNYAENLINLDSYSNPNHPLGKVCKKVKLDKITAIQHMGINNVHELYKLDVESSTRKNMKFQITYFLASDETQMSADKEMFFVEKSAFGKFPIKIRVFFI